MEKRTHTSWSESSWLSSTYTLKFTHVCAFVVVVRVCCLPFCFVSVPTLSFSSIFRPFRFLLVYLQNARVATNGAQLALPLCVCVFFFLLVFVTFFFVQAVLFSFASETAATYNGRQWCSCMCAPSIVVYACQRYMLMDLLNAKTCQKTFSFSWVLER